MKQNIRSLKQERSLIIFTLSSLILAIVSFVLYFINCNRDYYINDGIDKAVVIFTAAALISLTLRLLMIVFLKNELLKNLSFILKVVFIAFMTISFMRIVNERLLSITSIMTFDKNEYNLADMRTSLFTLGFYLISSLFATITTCFEKK